MLAARVVRLRIHGEFDSVLLRSSCSAQLTHEVRDDHQIDQQRETLPNAGMPDELVNFDGEQGCRRDDGEVLRPALAQCQADPFRKKNPGVDKRSHTEFPQPPIIQAGHFLQQFVNEMVVGIDLKSADPMLDQRRHVLVE